MIQCWTLSCTLSVLLPRNFFRYRLTFETYTRECTVFHEWNICSNLIPRTLSLLYNTIVPIQVRLVFSEFINLFLSPFSSVFSPLGLSTVVLFLGFKQSKLQHFTHDTRFPTFNRNSSTFSVPLLRRISEVFPWLGIIVEVK